MNKWTLKAGLCLALIFSPQTVLAYEYYTFDGFVPIVRAFTAISQIFASNDMMMLGGISAVPCW